MQVKDNLEKILNFFFPNECAVCGKIVSPSSLICERCESEIFSSGPSVKPEKLGCCDVHYFSTYSGKLRELILSYKRGRWRLHKILSELFLKLFDYYPPYPVLTYVPATLSSLEERGFDHMEMIAKNLSKRYGFVLKRALIPMKDERQYGKSARDRKSLSGKYRSDCRSKEITLIDDVYTTGATVKNAVSALKMSGVENVKVYVLAKVKG